MNPGAALGIGAGLALVAAAVVGMWAGGQRGPEYSRTVRIAWALFALSVMLGAISPWLAVTR